MIGCKSTLVFTIMEANHLQAHGYKINFFITKEGLTKEPIYIPNIYSLFTR